MAAKLSPAEVPEGGIIKYTQGTVAQVFDANGNCIAQEFVAGDECECQDREGNSLPTGDREEDAREDFYFPFAMPEPRHFCPGFTCPSCHSHRLEEVMDGVCVSSEIVGVGEYGDLEYGEQTNDDGEVDRYQCLNCGHNVAQDAQELSRYFGLPCENEE